jgi:hypothetical protein
MLLPCRAGFLLSWLLPSTSLAEVFEDEEAASAREGYAGGAPSARPTAAIMSSAVAGIGKIVQPRK